jgi:hypothetical protein
VPHYDASAARSRVVVRTRAGTWATCSVNVVRSQPVVRHRQRRLRHWLELSEGEDLITHARTGAARFLGYEITARHGDHMCTGGRRTGNGSIGLACH